MADVSLLIGGQHYKVSCRDGGEDHLRRIARIVDTKVAEARAAVGSQVSETRQFLLAALLLADALDEGAPQGSVDEAEVEALEKLAEQLESVSARLAPADRNT